MKWNAFKERMADYANLPGSRRRQYIFRGQGDRKMQLRTSLDRFVAINGLCGQPDRSALFSELMREFRRGALNLSLPFESVPTRQEWEILARHHGLPTPLLDFTESPYIAAYFALADDPAPGATEAVVWCLDRDVFGVGAKLDDITVVDDETLIRVNPRAVEQRGLFLEVGPKSIELETVLGTSLYGFAIDLVDRKQALIDLDAMLVNARSLFRDLDSAVRMAKQRVSLAEVK